MYKFSDFNKVYQNEKDYVLFNMISGNIVKIESANLRDYIEKSEKLSETTESIKELIEGGFAVPDDIDENLKIQFKINEMIYSRVMELVIIPTTNCNFRCEYCYQDFPDKNMDEKVQNSIINYVRKNIRNFAGLRVNWYGGEPLLARKTINYLSSELISICRKMGKPYIASITTNGYLLTKDVFTEMISNNIVTYVITIDGIEEYHNKFRHLKNGDGTFKNIVDNLKYIKENAPKKLFTILIRVNVTKSSLNYELKKLILFLEKEFGSDKRFEFLFYPVTDWGGAAVQQIKNEICDSYEDIFDFLISNKVKLNFGPYYKYLKLGSCWAAKRYSYLIDPEGLIKKCTLLVDREEHTIGRLKEDGKMEIDEYMLAKWILPERRKDNLCDTCKQKINCVSFCPFIKNFSVSNFECEFKFFDAEKIIELLLKCDKNSRIKVL